MLPSLLFLQLLVDLVIGQEQVEVILATQREAAATAGSADHGFHDRSAVELALALVMRALKKDSHLRGGGSDSSTGAQDGDEEDAPLAPSGPAAGASWAIQQLAKITRHHLRIVHALKVADWHAMAQPIFCQLLSLLELADRELADWFSPAGAHDRMMAAPAALLSSSSKGSGRGSGKIIAAGANDGAGRGGGADKPGP